LNVEKILFLAKQTQVYTKKTRGPGMKTANLAQFMFSLSDM